MINNLEQVPNNEINLTQLPREMIVEILKNLDLVDLDNVKQVSSFINSIAKEPSVLAALSESDKRKIELIKLANQYSGEQGSKKELGKKLLECLNEILTTPGHPLNKLADKMKRQYFD